MPGIGRPGDVMQTVDSRERIVLGLFIILDDKFVLYTAGSYTIPLG